MAAIARSRSWLVENALLGEDGLGGGGPLLEVGGGFGLGEGGDGGPALHVLRGDDALGGEELGDGVDAAFPVGEGGIGAVDGRV